MTPATMTVQALQRLSIYARVSSDEQRQNLTIQPQVETAQQWIKLQQMLHKPLDLYETYLDDGVSGTIPFAERPAGKRILEAAAERQFTLLVVYKIDRLGRDPRDILNSVHQLDQLGVAVKSLTEEFDLSTPSGKFMFNIFAAAAGFARDTQIERSIAGTNHWAKEGVWLGGIVPYGYYVTGRKKEARLVVSETPIPGLTLSEADVVRMIYRLLAEEGWSCVRIAEHLNALGIPPVYVRDNRQINRQGPDGKRKVHTAGIWMYNRIRNLAASTIYKGIHFYGLRSKKMREPVPRAVPAIVDAETWARAQETVHRNMLDAVRNRQHRYLLRGLLRCTICELTYHGSTYTRGGKKDVYYTCGGKIAIRGRFKGRCPSKAVVGIPLEQQLWEDIQDFLRHPGKVLTQLEAKHRHRQEQRHDLEHERLTCQVARSHKEQEKDSILDLYRRRLITIPDLERQLEKIAHEEATLQARLASLETTLKGQEVIIARLESAGELLKTLRKKLDGPVTWELKRELFEALVQEIRVETRMNGTKKENHYVVSYTFEERKPLTLATHAATRTGTHACI